MHGILVFFFTVCHCRDISTPTEIRLPPRITRSPPEKKTWYEKGKVFTIECQAEGTPAVSYEWKKSGSRVNTDNSIGTVTINRAAEKDEGYYQCFARNQYGTAVSNTIDVRMAFLNSTKEPPTVHRQTVVLGTPFHIQADRGRSFPKPRYDWYYAHDVDTPYYTTLWPTPRIQFAENGDVHFAYALPEDGHAEKIFSCRIVNPSLKVETRGCYTQLTVTQNSTGLSNFAPRLAFYSETQTALLIGENAKLRCFFYGFPEPRISWFGPGNRWVIPNGRYMLDNYNTNLTINNVASSDEGEYSCTGSNVEGSKTQSFQISVEAAPKFRSKTDAPYDVNVTEGESVTFNCNAFAKPEAHIIWFQNGQPINITKASKRFTFSNDNKSLTIKDVCRDCVDRESKTDLMVIQCNASNVHGYAFAQGYLNVLLRTKVTMINDRRNVSVDFLEENNFVFQCMATSDPSTPPTVRWYKTEPYGDLVRDEPPYVHVRTDILFIKIGPKCSASNCSKYLGEYRCVGNNGHSRDNQTIILFSKYRISQREHDTGRNGYNQENTEIQLSYKNSHPPEKIETTVLAEDRPTSKIVFTEDVTQNLFSKNITKSAFTEVIRNAILTEDKNAWPVWKTILVAAAISLALFLVGMFLDYRWKRRFGEANKQATGKKMQNHANINEDFGCDSIGIPLVEMVGRNERSTMRESGVYDFIDYDSIDRVLEEIGNKETATVHSFDARKYNRYDSMDAQQIQAMGGVRPTLDKDITCDDIAYLMPKEDVTINGETDQQQIMGCESVLKDFENSPRSDDLTKSFNTYSNLNGEKFGPNVELEKADFKAKETNFHANLASRDVVLNETSPNLDLSPTEWNQYLAEGPKVVYQYMDPEPDEENLYTALILKKRNQNLKHKEANENVELSLNKESQCMDHGQREVNEYTDTEPRDVNQCTALASTEITSNFDLDPQEINENLELSLNGDRPTQCNGHGHEKVDQNIDMEPRKVIQCTGLATKELNPCLNLDPKEVNLRSDLGRKKVIPTSDLGGKEKCPYLDPGLREVNPRSGLDSKEATPHSNPD